MKEIDLLIVGQGIAGINLSYIAKKKGLTCMHIHQSSPGESTKVAAGLINPITGRRFVKSWNIDTILPFAIKHYKELEDEFNINFTDRLHILRTFQNVAEENAWLAKSADPFLKEFLLDRLAFDKSKFSNKLKTVDLMGELQNCHRIKLSTLQDSYLNKLKLDDELIDEWVKLDDLRFHENSITYKSLSFKNIVFAEGWRSIYNSLWSHIPFAPSKGELFLVSAPDLKLNAAFKNTMFITPLGKDLYWVGATYEWKNYDPFVGEKMKEKLFTMLNNTLLCPYEIKAHLSGIRPSSKDRRPIIGPHHKYPHVYIFNGMGTKGSSLSPYYAHVLIDFIQEGKGIPFEVSTKRYPPSS